jgi:hypothetical protein
MKKLTTILILAIFLMSIITPAVVFANEEDESDNAAERTKIGERSRLAATSIRNKMLRESKEDILKNRRFAELREEILKKFSELRP